MAEHHHRCLRSPRGGFELQPLPCQGQHDAPYKAGEKREPKPKTTRRPREEEKERYNRRVASKLSHQHTSLPVSLGEDKQTASSSSASLPGSPEDSASTRYSTAPRGIPRVNSHWQTLRDAVTQSLAETITEEHKAPKQPWITKATWDLIQHRIRAREVGDKVMDQDLHRQMRSQARHDKTQWLKDRLAESEETVDARMKWKWIKRMRSGRFFVENHEGKPTSYSKQAQTFAEHLSHQQWAPQHHYTGSQEPILHKAGVDQSPTLRIGLRTRQVCQKQSCGH